MFVRAESSESKWFNQTTNLTAMFPLCESRNQSELKSSKWSNEDEEKGTQSERMAVM